MSVTIYALVERPAEGLGSGSVRYIGATRRSLRLRLNSHVADINSNKNEKSRRIAWLRSLTSRPRIVPIEVVSDDEWETKEIEWIAWARSIGFPLVNDSAGGAGPLGWNPSEETRATWRGQRLGNKFCVGRNVSEEMRAKLRAANLGKKASPEARAKMSASRKGRSLSAETRAKLSAANKGRPRSEETKAKLSKYKPTVACRAAVAAANRRRSERPACE